MRLSGVVEDLRRLGPYDHVCWAFDDVRAFRSHAATFLAGGLSSGQRVWFVGTPEDELRDALSAGRPGAVEVVTLSSTYNTGVVVDPDAQVRVYAEATSRALADGFTGLRVATDATPHVGTPAQLEAFTRYEHQIDRFMAARPFSAMCAYDRRLLGADTVAQLACMHPTTSRDTVPFRLHASTEPGCAASVGGELDVATTTLLDRALDRADLRPDRNGELVLDAAALTFVDHRGLLQLIRHAQRLDATLVLRTDQPGPRRLVDLLELSDVRVEGRP